MNTFVPENPTVALIRGDNDNEIIIASNFSNNVKVIITDDPNLPGLGDLTLRKKVFDPGDKEDEVTNTGHTAFVFE